MTDQRPLTVTYLLEDTQLFGGVKVVFRQAELVAARGHRVTLLSKGPEPLWHDLKVAYRQVTRFEAAEIPQSDVVVATDWPTLEPAVSAQRGVTAHFFQGDETSYTHNIADHPKIERAYSHFLPTLVVSPHLGKLVSSRYSRPWRVVAQPLEPFFRPSLGHSLLRRRPRRPPRILVVGPFECDWKGVTTALEAVAKLRSLGVENTLVRLSQLPLAVEESRVLEPDEFHVHLRPKQVARLVAGCDLLLAPSWEQEGFGLPALEAMACGTPVVASDVSSFRYFAGKAAVLVPHDRPNAFADAAQHVLTEPRVWRRLRRAGLEVASQHSEARAAEEAEVALRWVASGDWQAEVDQTD